MSSLNALIDKVDYLTNKVCCLEQRLADLTTLVDGQLPDAPPSATGTFSLQSVDGVIQWTEEP